MKRLFALWATCIAVVIGSSSSNAVLQLPEKPAGQPMGTFLDELFGDNGTAVANTTLAPAKRGLRKRKYPNSYGLHQSVWDVETDTGLATYNISVDFLNCGHGITFQTGVGTYTFTNGTTSDETSFRDLLTDQWSLRTEDRANDPWNLRYPGTNRPINTNYAKHTGVVAQIALDEGTRLLNNGLICKRAPGAATDPNIVNELRHLLANTHSYWTAVILNTALGGLAGAGIAALHDLAFKGNVSAQNVVQTGFVIATVRVVENVQANAVRAADNVVALVPGGREAVVQNVMIAWARQTTGPASHSGRRPRRRPRRHNRLPHGKRGESGRRPGRRDGRPGVGNGAQELEMEETANVGENGACNAV